MIRRWGEPGVGRRWVLDGLGGERCRDAATDVDGRGWEGGVGEAGPPDKLMPSSRMTRDLVCGLYSYRNRSFSGRRSRGVRVGDSLLIVRLHCCRGGG
jgi:hypothetical protein